MILYGFTQYTLNTGVYQVMTSFTSQRRKYTIILRLVHITGMCLVLCGLGGEHAHSPVSTTTHITTVTVGMS